jgi:hypothetical protein
MSTSLFHGLSAYRGARTPLTLISGADRVIGVQIATADRPIGPVGVVVAGDLHHVFDGDCWSWVDPYGVRHASDGAQWGYHAHAERFVEQGDLHLWIQEKTGETVRRRPRHYCEAFLTPRAITHVWYKPYATREQRMAARVIARRHGARIVDVTATTRIWEVVGDDPSTYRYTKLAANMGY